MTNRNVLHLTEQELDKPIYRVFPTSRLFQLFSTRKIALVKPSSWDDPFENLRLKSPVTVAGSLATISAKDSVYGQCWTKHRETDAMWRIYSGAKDGVRIRSTPRKLLNALRKSCSEHPELKCFVGGVTYLPKFRLGKALEKIDIFDPNGSGIAESLLYKRQEFSHEKEVRLIYIGNDGSCNSDTYLFNIDIENTIDRILFDPRMDEGIRQGYVDAIKKLGYKGEIRRSTLYDVPK